MLITHEQAVRSHIQEVRSNIHVDHCRSLKRDFQRTRSCENFAHRPWYLATINFPRENKKTDIILSHVYGLNLARNIITMSDPVWTSQSYWTRLQLCKQNTKIFLSIRLLLTHVKIFEYCLLYCRELIIILNRVINFIGQY